MLLIVGLGNPGPEYSGHRHNVGAMAADAIHARHRFGPWRKRFHSEAADGELSGRKCLVIKPATYMNESGRAVGEAARFYKLDPSDIVVIHDEIDLAPGKVRIKIGGGGAGHRGLRSVTAHIGPDYRRVRIGVGHPGHRDLVNRHVLHDFSKADLEWMEPLLEAIANNAPLLAEGKDELVSNRIHAAITHRTGVEQTRGRTEKARPIKAQEAPTESDSEETDGPFARLRRLFGGR